MLHDFCETCTALRSCALKDPVQIRRCAALVDHSLSPLLLLFFMTEPTNSKVETPSAPVPEKATDTPGQRQEEASAFVRSWEGYPKGYPMLAERIALKPQTAIYRRFAALNSRRILYLHAELCILERRLRKIEKEEKERDDGSGKRPSHRYAADYERMLEHQDGDGKPHLELLGTIGEKLNQYSELMSLAIQTKGNMTKTLQF